MRYLQQYWAQMQVRLEWKNWRLRNKLLTAFLYVGIIPAILIGVFSLQASQKVILSNTKQYTMEILYQINKNLTTQIETIHSVALSVVTNKQLRERLNADNAIELGNNRSEIEGYLRSIVINYDDIGEMIVVDRQGNFYWTGDGYINLQVEDAPDVYWQADAAEGSGMKWLGLQDNLVKSSLYGRAQVFPLMIPIKDYRVDDEMGMLITNLKASSVSSLIQDVYASQLGNILLLNEQHEIMLSTKPLDEAIGKADILSAHSGEATVVDIGGEEYFITALRNAGTGWHIVSVLPAQALLQGSAPLAKAIIGTMLLIILFSALFSIAISGDIVSGFKKLISSMKQVERGNWQAVQQTARRDEVGQLGNSFSRMVRQLKALVRRTYELKMRENEAELRALQSQIRPHFLYNTLGAINSILLEKGQYEASKVVIALSDMLRYTVSGTVTEPISMGEELEQVERYLQIQQFRFEERLTYKIESAASVERLLVPKLLLQPIVENAVVHGIENKIDGGHIAVACTSEDQQACLIVEDNGAGMDADELDRLRSMLLSQGGELRADGKGIGLANVMRRLQLLYGADFQFGMTSKPGSGTRIEIRIPLSGGEGRE